MTIFRREAGPSRGRRGALSRYSGRCTISTSESNGSNGLVARITSARYGASRMIATTTPVTPSGRALVRGQVTEPRAKPRPAPGADAARASVLPVDIQIGDRFTDEQGEWEV
jgi:hypothetical protein